MYAPYVTIAITVKRLELLEVILGVSVAEGDGNLPHLLPCQVPHALKVLLSCSNLCLIYRETREAWNLDTAKDRNTDTQYNDRERATG